MADDLTNVDTVVDAEDAGTNSDGDANISKWFRVHVPDYDTSLDGNQQGYLRVGAVPPAAEPGEQLIIERWGETKGNAKFALGGASYVPQPGWRDHTDGSRVVTTDGDKLEIVSGNYKLIVGNSDEPGAIEETTDAASIDRNTKVATDLTTHTAIEGGKASHTMIGGGQTSSLEIGGGRASHTAIGGGDASSLEVVGGRVTNTTIGAAEHNTKQVVGLSLSRTDVGIDMSTHTAVVGLKTSRTEVGVASIGHESVGGAHLFHRDVGGLRMFHTVVAGAQQVATEVGLSNESHKHVGGLDMSLTTATAVMNLNLLGSVTTINLLGSDMVMTAGLARVAIAVWGLDMGISMGAKYSLHLGTSGSDVLPSQAMNLTDATVNMVNTTINVTSATINAISDKKTVATLKVTGTSISLG